MTMLDDDLLPKQIDITANQARRLLLDRGLSDADIDNAAQGRMDAIQVANDDDTATDEYLLVSVLMACRDAQKRLNSGDIVEAIKRYSGQHEQVMYIAKRSDAQSGRASKEANTRNASKPRPSRRTRITKIVERLAHRPHESGELKSSGDLWPELYAELRDWQADPSEDVTDQLDPCIWFTDEKEKRVRITYGRFRQILSDARKRR